MDTATRTSLTTDSDHDLARLDRWTQCNSGQDTWIRPLRLYSPMILTTARLDNRWTQDNSGQDMDTATRTSFTNDCDHGPAWSGQQVDTTQQRTGHGYGHSELTH